jgi:hypothetical protein
MGASGRLGDGRVVAVEYNGAVERKRVERHGSSGVWEPAWYECTNETTEYAFYFTMASISFFATTSLSNFQATKREGTVRLS